MKIGVIAGLALAIVVVQPRIGTPAFSEFAGGQTGPVWPGSLFPFLFVTIACGALSGFHALISSGTTPKMVEKERQTRFIGYGGMLMEAFVAIMALVAAVSLDRGIHFVMNSPAALTGGAPTLAVGLAHIMGQLVGGDALMGFWYHFAIMFEALFILTAVDAGTRVARFMLQDSLGNVVPRFKDTSWRVGAWVCTAIMVAAWGAVLIMGVTDPLGGINTLFPLFGIVNQLLAAIALAVVLTIGARRREVRAGHGGRGPEHGHPGHALHRLPGAGADRHHDVGARHGARLPRHRGHRPPGPVRALAALRPGRAVRHGRGEGAAAAGGRPAGGPAAGAGSLTWPTTGRTIQGGLR